MRRATAVVLGTVAGTSLLVGAKLGNSGNEMAADDSGAGPVVVAGGPGAAASGPGGKASGPAGKGTAKASGTPGGSPGATPTTPGPGRTTGGPTPTGKPTGTGKPTSTPHPTPTPTPTPSGPADGTYSASAQVGGGRHGTLSMTVTISGHRITAISATESGGETNCYHSVCPTLTSEALAAQSANINSVTNATQTSDAYRSSLQAILNKANG
jgi:uncharacterized protein with FMN-binding domain